MSDPLLGFGNMIGGVFNGIGSMVNASNAKQINEENVKLQRETNAQNLALQQQTWSREDNAVQRRASDLKAAGINPLLAAGSAAQAGPAVHMSAPQKSQVQDSSGIYGLGSALLDIVRGNVAIAQTQAQTELTRQQIQAAVWGNEFAGQSLPLRLDQLRLQNIHSDLVNKGQELSNTAQSIANTFAPQLNKAKLTGMELENNFQAAANPIRLQSLAADLKRTNIANVNAELDTQLKNLGVTKAQLDIVAQKAANNIAFEKLNNLQKDTMIKVLTADALTLSNQQLKESTSVGSGVAAGVKSWTSVISDFVKTAGALGSFFK